MRWPAVALALGSAALPCARGFVSGFVARSSTSGLDTRSNLHRGRDTCSSSSSSRRKSTASVGLFMMAEGRLTVSVTG